MVQFATTRYYDRSAPGFMFTPPQERETESAFLPYNLQTLTATFGGVDPSVAGSWTVTFPLSDGTFYTFTYTTAGQALALDGPAFATAWNADAVAGKLYLASAVGAVVTLLAKSSNTQIAAGSFVVVDNGASTLTIAQTVASGAASLQMGLLYRAVPANALLQAFTGTFRSDVIAAPLTTGITVDAIRGMVGREANSTQMSADFLNTQPDRYLSGHSFPGLLRGEGAVLIDPASAAITPTTATIYAVLAVGANSLVGSITTVNDGGNVVQVNAGANPFLRPVDGTETPVFQFPQQRMVRCKFNRAN